MYCSLILSLLWRLVLLGTINVSMPSSKAIEVVAIVYNIINYPRLDIKIPYYDENYIHYSNIHMSGEVDNTSDIPERLSSGQFTRLSIPIVVDDAYLFDVQYKKTWKVCPGCVTIEAEDN